MYVSRQLNYNLQNTNKNGLVVIELQSLHDGGCFRNNILE